MMKKLFLWLVFLSIGMQAQVINFPDANFKALLLSSSPNNAIAKNLSGNYFKIDVNGDGEISLTEAQEVGELLIQSESNGELEWPDTLPINNYEGINNFTNATSITLHRITAPLNELKISSLNNLKSFSASFYNYDTGNINITNCQALVNLNCGGINLKTPSIISQLKSLNIFFPSSPDYTVLEFIKNAPLLENLTLQTGLNFSFFDDSRYSLDLSNHSNIKSVTIYSFGLYALNLSGCNQLNSLSIHGNYASYLTMSFGNINVSNCPMLTSLHLGNDFDAIGDLVANNCLNLKTIIIPADSGTLEVNNCPLLTSIDLKSNSGIQMSNIPVLKNISVEKFEGVSFDATPATNLEILKLSYNFFSHDRYFGPLKNITVKNNSFLKKLDISHQKISDVDVSGLQNLKSLSLNIYFNLNNQSPPDFSSDFLHHLNIENCPALEDVDIDSQYGLIDATFKNCGSLKKFLFNGDYYNGEHIGVLEKLNFENCSSLEAIDAENNKLTDLNIKNCTSLKEITCEKNQLTNLDVSELPNLESLGCGFNKLISLNIENNTKLNHLNIRGNSELTSLFIKNGVNSFGGFGPGIPDEDIFWRTPNLKYICADETESSYLKDVADAMGLTNVSVNTYCTFTPGGSYNTITGTAKYDANGNGCDATDDAFEYLKLKIDDGTNTGETFVQNDGKYEFYTQTGNFTVTPQAENPGLFTVSPSTFSNSFADNNSNTFTQDICVTANGTQNDAEVVIAPLTGARPGFDATYKLVWRNKGNTTLTGKVILNYDSNRMTFQSSSLPYSAISSGSLEFDYSNLKPYANAGSEITFTINTPTNPTNPVNSGDVLPFHAQITPTNGDLIPEDNSFSFNHTVVNSFDPNDITCMEGETIPTVAVGKYLHYVVNFENTGTAEAENIVVKMDIDPAEFDISTLQLQNASADLTTKITGNTVEFFFKKIKLKSGGHGNVLLKVKSITGLQEGDSVDNNAEIYFDYNFPVITNDYVTTILDATSVLAAKINYTAGSFSSGSYPVNFDAGLSTGNIVSYLWEFSGSPSVSSVAAAAPVVTYSVPGNYTAKLTVFDPANNTSTQTVTFKIGESVADLSTGKDSNNNFISIDSDDDDWKGYDINGVEMTPKVRHTFSGWSSADIGNGINSQWITLNTSEGYNTYKSIEFSIPANATDARLNLRSLSFTRNWTYLVKVNPDGSEDETEITKTQYLGDGAKGWLNSRSPKVDNYALLPGKYYIKVLVYSSNPSVRQSLDVNALVSSSSGLMYTNKIAPAAPTLDTNDVKTDKITIYPIPTKGEVNVAANDVIKNIEVYDASGRVVQKQNFSTLSKAMKMNIHSPRGVYYLKIKTTKEEITQKIIKQ